MDNDTVIITKERYKQLLKSELKLEMLETNSVECWRYYDSTLADEDNYYGNSYEVLCRKIDKKISEMY